MTATATPPIDDAPARASIAIALAASLAGALALAVSTPSLTAGVLGFVLVALGLARGWRTAVTLGGAGLFCGVVLAGLVGAPASVVVFATAATVVAWDVATFGIEVGEELGREADTRRLELVHAGASSVVAAIPAGIGLALFRTASGGTALVPIALLCGAVVLVVVLRP
ncbi:DUF7519 family protein [Halococcus agarilyticus]|uniref:DUF7519 family protein n=1 Tax=Halococcus agarilyticus TaxID=1232219 RepID=UPI000677D4E4|nr:hypothetical protein [Halococcus agarilyticus]